MTVDLGQRRLTRLAGAVVATAGALSWAALLARLQLRGLHILQLEGYQTGRYLRWTVQQRGRWASTPAVLGSIGTIGIAAFDLATGPRLSKSRLGLAAWAALGGWLWRSSRPAPATKPLVLTARAKRLLAGQSLLTVLVATVPAVCARSATTRPYAIPRLMIGMALASLVMPLLTAGANLLLWPVEEAFRRYYLADARRKLRAVSPTVVGVAGSYGKTSTKELTATILGARWSVLKPPGSYNTPMGISRVLREQLTPSHEVFVAELGDYVPGDIGFLCDLVNPSIGILTTIGPEHLERFKTMERIVETKQELIDALPPDGVAVVNQDDPLVRTMGDRAAARGLRVIRYGQIEPGAQVRARDVHTTRDGLTFTVEADGRGEAQFKVGLLGRHNVMNVLAATGAALALGMSLPEIAVAARRVEPVEHRLQPIQGAGGVLVIDDTYNSNPRGAAEALAVLGELPGGKKLLVTPGMIELAEREAEEHRLLGKRAAAVCDEVILVGPERTRPIAEGLLAAGFPPGHIHVVESRDAATRRLGTLLESGDVLLWENDLPDTYVEVTGDRRQGTGVRIDNRDARGQGAADQGAIHRAPTASGDLVGAQFIAPLGGVRSLLVDGLRTVYREDGSLDAPPLVILHGWGASIAAVATIQACFSPTHRTIALDLPGFGASDPPPDPWGAQEYASHLRAFLKQFGVTRASFIGHSHGGRVAIVLAATLPELVDRLVLVDSAGLRPKRSLGYYIRVYSYKASRRLLTLPGLSGPLGAPLRRQFETRVGSDDYRQAGSMRGTLVRVVNEDWRHLLPKIAAPTLLIWGELDDATPVSDGQLMEQLIPDAGLVVFPGAGHFAYADDVGRFARVVGHFLARRQNTGDRRQEQ
ncbi:MAG TPA: alpha/beta fold hydrolase [Chloroflexota bacterium]|nr:alpha/beta fold hydrolase [Chloroflexota bacterium]